MLSARVRDILNGYPSETPGVLANLARMMNSGYLAGTGKMIVLPVDQGLEHGPARSFAPNPAGYDPRYHVELAIEAGCSGYAAPLGFLQSVARDFAAEIPLILKLHSNDSLLKGQDPSPAMTASVKEALRLGCCAIGATLYPGSGARNRMMEQLQSLIAEAREAGLPTIVWSYPRGGPLSKEGETALDMVAYAAHMACELGAHIVIVKPPSAFLEQAEAKKVYERHQIPITRLRDRVAHVVQSAFGGKRILLFSGGEARGREELFQEVAQIAAGGGFGSIMGRNAFQRPKAEALELLREIIKIYQDPASSSA